MAERTMEAMASYARDLEAERDRLREALKRISIAHAPAEHLQRIAREALGPGEGA